MFRIEGEGVYVDTNSRDVSVVLVRLYFVEVTTFTYRETIVTVELDQTSDDRVFTGHTFNTSYTVTRFQGRAVPPVRVVEWLLAFPRIDDGIIATDE